MCMNEIQRRQEASPTGVEHVLRQVDAHDHHLYIVVRIFHRVSHLISTDTMHQCVVDSTTPKNTMWMLGDDLDERGPNQCTGCNGGKSLLQQDVTTRCMHTITDNQAWHQLTTSTITSRSKSWSHHSRPSINDVLHGLLKPCCLTWVHVHRNVESCQVSIVGCNSHRVGEESWG